MESIADVHTTRTERFSATGLPAPSARPISAVDWAALETTSHLALAERVARAGAGALLIAVGLAELVLGGWESGPWQRSVALLFAAAGALVLARTVSKLGRRAIRADAVAAVSAGAIDPVRLLATLSAGRMAVVDRTAARS